MELHMLEIVTRNIAVSAVLRLYVGVNRVMDSALIGVGVIREARTLPILRTCISAVF